GRVVERAVVAAGDLPLEGVAAELTADGCAVDGEDAAVVALHEHADGPAAERCGQSTGAGANAALPAERDRARARADGALLDGPGGRGLERAAHVLGPDGAGADVVERAVVGLADDGVDGPHVLH